MKQNRTKAMFVPLPDAWQLRRPQHNVYSKAMLSTVYLLYESSNTTCRTESRTSITSIRVKWMWGLWKDRVAIPSTADDSRSVKKSKNLWRSPTCTPLVSLASEKTWEVRGLVFEYLTVILLTSTKWWVSVSASKWRMGFNSAFKGLKL